MQFNMKLTVVLLICSLSLAKGNSILNDTGGLNVSTTTLPRNIEVTFDLYTSLNPTTPQELRTNDINVLVSSNFNQRGISRFITDGLIIASSVDIFYDTPSTLLEAGAANVFIVKPKIHDINQNYDEASRYVKAVGQLLAEFIDFLHKEGGMSFSSLGLLGQNLGADISGYAGKHVTGGVINSICAIDPSNYKNCKISLCSTDAENVKICHTNVEHLLEHIGNITHPCYGVGLPINCVSPTV